MAVNAQSFPLLVAPRRSHAHQPTPDERRDRIGQSRSCTASPDRSARWRARERPMVFALGLLGLGVVLFMTYPLVHGT